MDDPIFSYAPPLEDETYIQDPNLATYFAAQDKLIKDSENLRHETVILALDDDFVLPISFARMASMTSAPL